MANVNVKSAAKPPSASSRPGTTSCFQLETSCVKTTGDSSTCWYARYTTNGVPVLTALKITEQIMANVILKEAIAKTREEVTDGKTIAQPLARSKVFPQLMVDLVKIGEETGDVPGSLNNLADTYENELQIALRVMSDLIGPVLIIVMAIVVGFLLLSIFLPLFKLISSIH